MPQPIFKSLSNAPASTTEGIRFTKKPQSRRTAAGFIPDNFSNERNSYLRQPVSIIDTRFPFNQQEKSKKANIHQKISIETTKNERNSLRKEENNG